MTYGEFVDEVADRAMTGRAKAEAFTSATLRTLGERLTGGEADDVAAQLPQELKGLLLAAPPEAERFGVDEFLRRVKERANAINKVDAERGARAVLATLRHAVTAGEFEDMLAQLPAEFVPLVDLTVAPAGP
jgi:uncharacterized protein (DUF2267 family)